jgi:hypothetical protein
MPSPRGALSLWRRPLAANLYAARLADELLVRGQKLRQAYLAAPLGGSCSPPPRAQDIGSSGAARYRRGVRGEGYVVVDGIGARSTFTRQRQQLLSAITPKGDLTSDPL